jgi:hypothetical protein
MLRLEMNQDFKDIIAIEITSVSDKAPICPFIVGEPGIGKSSVIRAMCEEHGWHFFELLCNQLGDRADLTGCRSVKVEEKVNGLVEETWKQIFFPHQSIQDAITCARNNPDDIVVLFLDEINRTSADITSAILSFTTARSIGTFKFPDNVRFIVAGNDKGNVTAIDTASISRFAKYALKPNAKTWMEYTKDADTLNPYIAQVLTINPALIFCKNCEIVSSTVSGDDGDEIENEYEAFDDVAEGFEQITTPRTISGLNAFLNKCSLDQLTNYVGTIMKDEETGEDTSLLQTIVYGHVGHTAFGIEVCRVIADDVAKGQMQKAASVVKPTMPKAYKTLKKCADRQTRDDMIRNMTDDEKSAVLLYAVWEPKDNADLIEAIAQNYTQALLTGAYQPQFTNLKSHDELNVDNYAALINTNTQIGATMKAVLGD